jgi:hypothetical protein
MKSCLRLDDISHPVVFTKFLKHPEQYRVHTLIKKDRVWLQQKLTTPGWSVRDCDRCCRIARRYGVRHDGSPRKVRKVKFSKKVYLRVFP